MFDTGYSCRALSFDMYVVCLFVCSNTFVLELIEACLLCIVMV